MSRRSLHKSILDSCRVARAKRSSALLVVALLAACGFQIRGAADVPPEMARTYIEAPDRYSLFYRKLRDALRNNGVAVVDGASDATTVFSILSDDTGQRVISVSARNVPRDYEVWYTVGYRVTSGERTLIDPTNQTLTRDYTYDETKVLGKAREEEILRAALADDLVRIVLIQISAL
ncbi:MAG: LPS assembly lipoprotein LptE [Woeseiaceae bacterium]